MVALVGIGFQVLVNERMEAFESGVGSAGEGVDRWNGAVKIFEAPGDVFGERFAGKGFWHAPLALRPGAVGSDEEFGECSFEVRAHVLEQEVVATEDGGGHDDVGIDGPVRKLEATGENVAPALRFAAGIFVADEDGGVDFIEEFFKGVIGMAAEDEADTAMFGVFFDVTEALLHEVVVTEVGVGVVRNDGEEDDNGKGEEIGSVDGDVEGGIVMDAHGALHPVDDTPAVGEWRAVAPDEDAGVVGEFCEVLGLRGRPWHWQCPLCGAFIVHGVGHAARMDGDCNYKSRRGYSMG
jgi:hypothetical protein